MQCVDAKNEVQNRVNERSEWRREVYTVDKVSEMLSRDA